MMNTWTSLPSRVVTLIRNGGPSTPWPRGRSFLARPTRTRRGAPVRSGLTTCISSSPLHKHDKLGIAFLKCKLDRATRAKYDARGESFDDDENLFGSDEDPSCITKQSGKSTSARNALKKKPSPVKKARFKDAEELKIGKPLYVCVLRIENCVLRNCPAVRIVWFCSRGSYLSAVGTNMNGNLFEADSHGDTICLGDGALKIMDFNTPVNVHGYGPSLLEMPPDIPPGYPHAGFGPPLVVPYVIERKWGHGE